MPERPAKPKARSPRRSQAVPAEPAPARSGAGGDWDRLAAALDRLRRDAPAGEEPGDASALAQAVAEAAVGELGFAGARLWRLPNGSAAAGTDAGMTGAVVWQQSGRLPAPDPGAIVAAVAAGGGPACVPINAGADGKGALALEVTPAGPEAGRAGGGALPLLQIFCRFAGMALASAERRRAVDELSSIVEATKQLNSTLDLGELINIILRIATRLTGAERGTVFLVDSERQEIWSLVGLGLGQQEIRLPVTKGIAGYVARSGETVNLPDAYADPRFEPEVDRKLGFRTRALLCLPIRNKDNEIVGVLQLLNQSRAAGVFDATDENFLRALSEHVALALENAQLHRELLAKQRMERDLALARTIQASLLPEAAPRIEGYDIFVSHRASQMVGGDYYDFMTLGEDALLSVVADVEGKGVASALVMSNLQATIRALVQHVHALERIVALVNDMILTDTRGRKFMSMFVGVLDPRHRTFHYINAGHVPPVVLRASGEAVRLEEGGMVVGIFPGVPYERGQLRLESGDILVACTDGITEAMNRDGEEYGLERLVATVANVRTDPARAIVETVLADVDRFSRGGAHEDDRIIFILKVE